MPDHRGIPIWELEIPVAGLVSVQHSLSLNVRKEIQDLEAFYSNVIVVPKDYGFLIKLTAFAPTPDQAEEAGLVFLGRMLDVLSLNIDASLNIMNQHLSIIGKEEARVKRVLDQSTFIVAFKDARELTLSETTYLRALGWFRKGKCTPDPLDKFLSFWSAIETVAAKYNPNKQECANRGSKCHIWECFKHVWGDCSDWPLIPGKANWIDLCNEKRTHVAHGTIATDVESVRSISSLVPEVEAVCHRFLEDWKSELLLNVDPELMN